MKFSKTAALRAVLIPAAFLMAACGKAAAPEPTPDMDTIATRAVQTMEAHSTATAMAVPTETPLPTYTPFSLPSAETDAAAEPFTPAYEESAEASADEALPVSPADVPDAFPDFPVPTATAAEAGANKAAWQSQTPADGDHIEPGSEFDITWYMMNTGTTTWTTDYCMRYFAGTNLTKPGKLRYNLSAPVAPGEVGACSVDAVAPWTAGTYQMSVVLSNENDENFSIVDITIVVD